MQESPILEVDAEPEEVVVDELVSLKARADKLGIKYHPSISTTKLREKVQEALSDDVVPAKTEAVKDTGKETELQLRGRKRREANALIRIRVSCMNPNKKEWDGEIITTGNTNTGTIKKFVPFNSEEGYHVPHMIYEQLLQRQCQVFVTVKDNRGNKVRKGKLIKEFAIEVLPPLTEKELKELAQRQAMASGSAD